MTDPAAAWDEGWNAAAWGHKPADNPYQRTTQPLTTPQPPERILTGTLHNGTHLLVTIWPDGAVEAATRTHSWHTWSPPTELNDEPT